MKSLMVKMKLYLPIFLTSHFTYGQSSSILGDDDLQRMTCYKREKVITRLLTAAQR